MTPDSRPSAVMQGVGTDIILVARIAALLDRYGPAFAHRWFTAGEVAHCTEKAVPSRHFAARLAAKEAVLKALPFVWNGPVPWRMLEIVQGRHGAPAVELSGEMLAEAQRAGVGDIAISMSHCDEYATAIALVSSSATRAAMVDAAADRARIERLLTQWAGVRQAGAHPELEAIRLAVVFEDAFELTLTDDDIHLAILTDPDAMISVLSRRPWREGMPD